MSRCERAGAHEVSLAVESTRALVTGLGVLEPENLRDEELNFLRTFDECKPSAPETQSRGWVLRGLRP